MSVNSVSVVAFWHVQILSAETLSINPDFRWYCCCSLCYSLFEATSTNNQHLFFLCSVSGTYILLVCFLLISHYIWIFWVCTKKGHNILFSLTLLLSQSPEPAMLSCKQTAWQVPADTRIWTDFWSFGLRAVWLFPTHHAASNTVHSHQPESQ